MSATGCSPADRAWVLGLGLAGWLATRAPRRRAPLLSPAAADARYRAGLVLVELRRGDRTVGR